jgi:hypothetical protein
MARRRADERLEPIASKIGDALLDQADGVGIMRVLAKDLLAVARKPRLDVGQVRVAHECHLGVLGLHFVAHSSLFVLGGVYLNPNIPTDGQ